MIIIENLTKKFGDLLVLKDINLSVSKGEVVSIIGPSGMGKSTLLRCINFLEIPNKGQITIGDFKIDVENIDKKGIHELRKRTAMVFQNFNLFKNKTVIENIMEPYVTVQGIKKLEAQKRAESILEQIGLIDKKDQYPARLSGGQKQRVAIGRALAVGAEIILLDEPTSALDPGLVEEVLDLIGKLAQKDITMLIVTHEMSFAREVSDRVLIMDKGGLTECKDKHLDLAQNFYKN